MLAVKEDPADIAGRNGTPAVKAAKLCCRIDSWISVGCLAHAIVSEAGGIRVFTSKLAREEFPCIEQRLCHFHCTQIVIINPSPSWSKSIRSRSVSVSAWPTARLKDRLDFVSRRWTGWCQCEYCIQELKNISGLNQQPQQNPTEYRRSTGAENRKNWRKFEDGRCEIVYEAMAFCVSRMGMSWIVPVFIRESYATARKGVTAAGLGRSKEAVVGTGSGKPADGWLIRDCESDRYIRFRISWSELRMPGEIIVNQVMPLLRSDVLTAVCISVISWKELSAMVIWSLCDIGLHETCLVYLQMSRHRIARR